MPVTLNNPLSGIYAHASYVVLVRLQSSLNTSLVCVPLAIYEYCFRNARSRSSILWEIELYYPDSDYALYVVCPSSDHVYHHRYGGSYHLMLLHKAAAAVAMCLGFPVGELTHTSKLPRALVEVLSPFSKSSVKEPVRSMLLVQPFKFLTSAASLIAVRRVPLEVRGAA